MPEHRYAYPPLSENQAKKLRALKQKKYRDVEKTFLAEGLRLCEDAVSAGADIAQAVFTQDALQHSRAAALAQKIQELKIPLALSSARQFKSLSDEQSPQGVLCAVHKTKPVSIEYMSSHLILACENIQDPGNLGAIFRSADWFGVKNILLSPGCVDAYNPKVVRGSMGAIFRLNIVEQAALPQILPAFKEKGWRIIGAVLDAPKSLKDVPPQNDIILIGNEANGLSEDVTALIDEPISIPGSGGGESLNAAMAASICLYHFSQN